MPKSKFYVVWEGFNKGIYYSWNDCKQQIDNYKNAKYKAFETESLAKEALNNGFHFYIKPKESSTNSIKPKLDSQTELVLENSICVDAACNVPLQKFEYRGVLLKTNEVLFHKGPFFGGSNNIGEFLAIVHAMAFMTANNLKMNIYSDSNTAITWVKRKKVNTKVKTSEIVDQLIQRAINWLNNNKADFVILKWNTTKLGEIPADFGRK